MPPFVTFRKEGNPMMTHIVMWKFCDAEGKTKAENIELVQNGLEGLMGKVPALQSIRFFKNEVVCDRNFDAMLVVETQDEAALDAYKNHPAHKAVAAYVAKVTCARAAVDIC